MHPTLTDDFTGRFSALREDADDLCDYTIACGGLVWRVHRVVLHLSSKVLSRACRGPFLEGNSGRIDLVDDEPGAVGAMIEYLYTGTYAVPLSASNFGHPASHVHVCIIADKYDIPGLKHMAIKRFDVSAVDEDAIAAAVQALNVTYIAHKPAQKMYEKIVELAVRTHQAAITDGHEIVPFHEIMMGDATFATMVADRATTLLAKALKD